MLFIWWHKHRANALSESHRRRDEVWDAHSVAHATGAFGRLAQRGLRVQIWQRRSWIKRSIVKSKFENNLSTAKGEKPPLLLQRLPPPRKSFQQFYLADATKPLLLKHGCTCLYETRTKRKRDPISRAVQLQFPVRSPMLPSPLLLLAFPTVVTLIGSMRRRFTGGAWWL